ncbi:MAG TPA: L,D-transpeptidase family protein [Thermomicrobiales bacterium]|nr:L,D-transpeptidase family protein [Thermomicrobiales bacterium]
MTSSSPLRLNRRRLMGALPAIGALSFVSSRFGPTVAAQDVAPSRYFAKTGHNLRGSFLHQWTMLGGEVAVGLPISEEGFRDGVGIVQSFEGITLLLDPSKQPPADVAGVPLPKDFIASFAPANALKNTDSCPKDAFFCQYFPQTGHSVSGRFASYWGNAGDLSVLGMPVSEPFEDTATGKTTQVFERAILVDYGESDVRLAKIGREIDHVLIDSGDPSFPAAPPMGGTTKLINSPEGLRLRSGPGLTADIVEVLPDSAEFILTGDEKADWVPGYADGYSGWVSSEFLKEPPPLPAIDPKDWNPKVWQGATLGDTNVRAEPSTQSEAIELKTDRSSIVVVDWVKGEELFPGADEWSKLEGQGYIYSRNVGRNAPVLPTPLPKNAPKTGRWIDVQLTQQLITLYDDRDPVRVVVTTTGMAGWETPEGEFTILWRVPNETMSSGAIGAEHFFKLEDVLYTQYFTDEGHAIHYAWWRTPETIGRPGSHGCLNVLLDDSAFMWDWAEVGTPVIVHKD